MAATAALLGELYIFPLNFILLFSIISASGALGSGLEMTHFFNNKQVLMENVSFQDLTLFCSLYNYNNYIFDYMIQFIGKCFFSFFKKKKQGTVLCFMSFRFNFAKIWSIRIIAFNEIPSNSFKYLKIPVYICDRTRIYQEYQ